MYKVAQVAKTDITLSTGVFFIIVPEVGRRFGACAGVSGSASAGWAVKQRERAI
jgi:hypothetical protein